MECFVSASLPLAPSSSVRQPARMLLRWSPGWAAAAQGFPRRDALPAILGFMGRPFCFLTSPHFSNKDFMVQVHVFVFVSNILLNLSSSRRLVLQNLKLSAACARKILLASGHFRMGLPHSCLAAEFEASVRAHRFGHEHACERSGAHLSMSVSVCRAPLRCNLFISRSGPWTALSLALRPSLRPRAPLAPRWQPKSQMPSY